VSLPQATAARKKPEENWEQRMRESFNRICAPNEYVGLHRAAAVNATPTVTMKISKHWATVLI
jgi:hypothetical protein